MSDPGQLTVEKLQQELSLKQLQINSLLTITQAINDNVAAPELYNMYKSFIGWEMGIRKMALFFNEEDEWICTTQLKADILAERRDLGPALLRYAKTQRITENDPGPFQGFDLIMTRTNTRASSSSRRLPTSSPSRSRTSGCSASRSSRSVLRGTWSWPAVCRRCSSRNTSR